MFEVVVGMLTFISKKVGNIVARFINDPVNYEEDSDGNAILGLTIIVITLSIIGYIAAWLR